MRVLAAYLAGHLCLLEAQSKPVRALPASVTLLAAVLAPLIFQCVNNGETLHERVSLQFVSGFDIQNWLYKVDAALQVLIIVSLNQDV